MRILQFAVSATMLLGVVSCADGRSPLDATAPEQSAARQSIEQSAARARQVQASGHFDAVVDFSTLTLTPRGQNCLLQVRGQLIFTGTIVGVANGQTSALVFAPCAEVASNPPGTFPDVFHSNFEFVGTVDGILATAKGTYAGRVQPGGHIDGRIVFSQGVQGRLTADAQVAVGGDYSGRVVVN